MPKLNQILEKTKKRLDLSQFFGEETYITLKKLSLLTLRKLQYISLSSLQGQIGKEMIKVIKEKGVIEENEAVDILSKLDLDSEASNNMMNNTNAIEKILFDCGIDEDDHNFYDENGVKIKLNYETIITFANEELLTHIVNEIKSFSEGFSLGELKETV